MAVKLSQGQIMICASSCFRTMYVVVLLLPPLLYAILCLLCGTIARSDVVVVVGVRDDDGHLLVWFLLHFYVSTIPAG